MRIRHVLLPLLLTLTACGVKPDGSNGEHQSFSLPGTSYQAAYQRAITYARTCHTGGMFAKGFTVSNEIFDDSRRAAVHIQSDSTIVEDIKIQGTKEGSQVTIINVGHGYWSKHQRDRAQRSIESGSPICS